MSTVSEQPEKLKVLIADDSAVVRSFLRRFIEEDESFVVAGTATNGQRAVEMVEANKYDVLILDIEMPVMDGLTALPLLVKADPSLQIIVASTLTLRNAEISMKCLAAGAAECLAKPTSDQMGGAQTFRRELLDKLKTLGGVTRRKRRPRSATATSAVSSAPSAAPVVSAVSSSPQSFELRKEMIRLTPDVLAVGSSTGGPQALLKFFAAFTRPLRQPVFLTQHMPATFTTILAEHITKQTGVECREAVDGEVAVGGRIYMAPGGYHMTVGLEGGQKIVSLNQDPPENFCRPAADPMLRSIVEVYGKKTLAVILTGMGSDGLKGCQGVVEAGGVVLAQDEATSVVWGMPGAVAKAGICSQVLPLEDLAVAVAERVGAR